ncbi:MAG: Fic family protein [Bacteroidales bacterium]|nr:Fic family protein [Bacteroidales bacterium]
MTKESEILQYLHYHPSSSRSEIEAGMHMKESPATVKRLLASLVQSKSAIVTGQGRATRYSVSPQTHITMELNIDTYFQKETDEREVQTAFKFELINDILPQVDIFTAEEKERLASLQTQFTKNLEGITPTEYRKEMERLGIDLSWKSSQIEGNTYSLLETEKLLREKQTASGKTKEEAVMLLNHKDALDFVLAEPEYFQALSVRRIEELHTLLVKELDVDKGIRKRRVGVTGTNYRPLDNEHQIREALEDTCRLINSKENVFEKALLSLVLISYIQAFADGNKRTARITGNAILIANNCCPISFRTVDSVDYKKAMLIFYEQNNISAFKKIFIDQFAFAVQTYF